MYLSRRSLLVSMPSVILTPGLLMPVKTWWLPKKRTFRTDGEILWECMDGDIDGGNWVEIEWGSK